MVRYSRSVDKTKTTFNDNVATPEIVLENNFKGLPLGNLSQRKSGWWLLHFRSPSWYYSEPFVTWAIRRPLSLLGTLSTLPHCQHTHTQFFSSFYSRESSQYAENSPFQEVEDRLRGCKGFFFLSPKFAFCERKD